jgi:hypothetical protein
MIVFWPLHCLSFYLLLLITPFLYPFAKMESSISTQKNYQLLILLSRTSECSSKCNSSYITKKCDVKDILRYVEMN